MGEKEIKFEVAQDSVRREQGMRERLRSLQGMILRGGQQGEDAKKVLLREFPEALGLVVALERKKKKKK